MDGPSARLTASGKLADNRIVLSHEETFGVGANA
jgi:hypothetical protein